MMLTYLSTDLLFHVQTLGSLGGGGIRITFLLSPTFEISLEIQNPFLTLGNLEPNLDLNLIPDLRTIPESDLYLNSAPPVCQPDQVLFVLFEGDVLLWIEIFEAGVVGAEEECNGGGPVGVHDGILYDLVNDQLWGKINWIEETDDFKIHHRSFIR